LQGVRRLSQIETLIRYENEHTALKFRPTQYFKHQYDELLRDVVALANADANGERVIVLGVEINSDSRRLIGFPREQCVVSGTYEAMVQKHIEPPLRVRYRTCDIEGKCIGLLTISDCNNPPYLISNPLPPNVRSGEAWIRRGAEQMPLARADLDRMYSRRLDDGLFRGGVKVGFAGPKPLSSIVLSAIGPYQSPSAQASAKLAAAIQAREMLASAKNVASSAIIRLTHLRLFGHDAPYRTKSLEQLRLDLQSIAEDYREQDAHHRFEKLGHRVNFTLINRGTDTIVDASASIELPNGAGVEVAPRIFASLAPDALKGSKATSALPSSADYPPVTVSERTVRITSSIGDVPRDAHVDLFREPLRVVVNDKGIGSKVPVRVTIHGRNLPAPIVVTLCIVGARSGQAREERERARDAAHG
jgi:hypothetical protein